MLRPLPATASCRNLVQKNQAKPAHFDFFAINFTVWSHILSTVGDALTTFDTPEISYTLKLCHFFTEIFPQQYSSSSSYRVNSVFISLYSIDLRVRTLRLHSLEHQLTSLAVGSSP